MHVIKLKDKSMAMQDNEKCTTAWQRDGKANNASLSWSTNRSSRAPSPPYSGTYLGQMAKNTPKIKDNYMENYHKKVKLWKMRYEKLKLTRTDNWSIKDLESSLKSLKSNKTRDPSGLLNELFTG